MTELQASATLVLVWSTSDPQSALQLLHSATALKFPCQGAHQFIKNVSIGPLSLLWLFFCLCRRTTIHIVKGRLSLPVPILVVLVVFVLFWSRQGLRFRGCRAPRYRVRQDSVT